ncbi:hypothetical protein [Sporosarcina sp. OR05]|uniref:hypothetical protein n=1 Tax=Sporosarcina sp. OR05 TaxID=2969819 RepID=UPI00352BD03B
MKMTLRDITEYRRNEKCYLIEHDDGDYFVVYGSKYREVIGGELWDLITAFVNEKINWKQVSNRLIFNRDDEFREGHKHKWSHFDNESKNKVLDVQKLYIDGEKRELDSIINKDFKFWD